MLKKYEFTGDKKLDIKKISTNSKDDKVDRKEIEKKYEKNVKRMVELQERLYADKKEGFIIVFQALDAAGKDSSIKHVMTEMYPQGVFVHSFKAPSSEELAHDYLWRIHAHVPARGEIAVFNRSHYEDLITVQVHSYQEGYEMADRIKKQSPKEFFEKRYDQVRNFEEYLYENSYRIVKIFLNVSKEKQLERFLERIDRHEKNWKFNSDDLRDRALFDEYLKTFERVINETATDHSPWYVIPADQKWYTRYLISEIMVKALEDIDPKFPEADPEEIASLEESRKILMEEINKSKKKDNKDDEKEKDLEEDN